MVLRRKKMARHKSSGLNKLVGLRRECSNDVIIGAKIVESAIGITENLEMHRSSTDVLPIGFDPGAGRSRLYEHVIGHCVIRSPFSPRWDCLTAPKQTCGCY